MTAISVPRQPHELPEQPPIDLEDLRQLMRTVTESSERLEGTYAALQEQVRQLKGELAEANEQLRRSKALAALGEMAAGIAHEVRNPLGSIGLYSQMLVEDLADRPDKAHVARRIGRAVERIDAIVRDVLRFARDTTIQPAPVPAGRVVAEALDSCQSLLAESQIEARVDDGGDLELHADASLLVQALGNVIRNAVEAMAEHECGEPVMDVSVRRARRRVPDGGRQSRIVIAVHDRGPGLNEEILERMFNPFFTTRAAGTGLGLAIVNRIVEAHGGHLHVANRDGGGASIELCLPEQQGC